MAPYKESAVDWDGVGTFALFLSSGAIGLGIIALRGYQAWLASSLEKARLSRPESDSGEVQDQIQHLENQVAQLSERVDFSERLLAGRHEEGEGDLD
jgi:hypothetical protein